VFLLYNVNVFASIVIRSRMYYSKCADLPDAGTLPSVRGVPCPGVSWAARDDEDADGPWFSISGALVLFRLLRFPLALNNAEDGLLRCIRVTKLSLGPKHIELTPQLQRRKSQ
jgi:hypothetical protein